MALILGVTGSIASGKSALSRHLVERHGAVHADGDRLVHGMYAPGTPGFDRVVETFGAGVVASDGTIDRRALGALIFGNRERTAALKAAIGDVASEVRSVVERWHAELPADALAVLEVFSLLENGYAPLCDAIWIVATDDANALDRIVARDGLTRADAEVRLRSARSWEIRAPGCDLVLFNNGTREAFTAQVDAAIDELRAHQRAGTLPRPKWRDWPGFPPPEAAPATE